MLKYGEGIHVRNRTPALCWPGCSGQAAEGERCVRALVQHGASALHTRGDSVAKTFSRNGVAKVRDSSKEDIAVLSSALERITDSVTRRWSDIASVDERKDIHRGLHYGGLPSCMAWEIRYFQKRKQAQPHEHTA